MQHGTPQRVSEATARQPAGRSLRTRLQSLSRVARPVFHTISQYPAAITFVFSTTSSAPYARDFVPAHISECTGLRSGIGVSRRGRIVS